MDINLISTLGSAALGALAGSLSAFLLGRVQQARDQKNRDHAALLSTQLALISQWTILEQMRKGLLEPFRNNPESFLHMPVYQTYEGPLRVDFSKLAFIANSNDPDLFQQIHIAEQAYLTAMGAHHTRNQLLEKFYAESKVESFDPETGHCSGTAPRHTAHMLKLATTSLYGCVDGALDKLDVETRNVGKFIKSNFKGRRALHTEPLVGEKG